MHARWVLAGLCIQDVWGPVDPRNGELVPEGTTLRFYDPKIDAWKSTWISPVQRAVRRFIGRQVGSEVVFREVGAATDPERWIFFEIEPHAFRWRSERRPGRNGPFGVIESYRMQRKPAPSPP